MGVNYRVEGMFAALNNELILEAVERSRAEAAREAATVAMSEAVTFEAPVVPMAAPVAPLGYAGIRLAQA